MAEKITAEKLLSTSGPNGKSVTLRDPLLAVEGPKGVELIKMALQGDGRQLENYRKELEEQRSALSKAIEKKREEIDGIDMRLSSLGFTISTNRSAQDNQMTIFAEIEANTKEAAKGESA